MWRQFVDAATMLLGRSSSGADRHVASVGAVVVFSLLALGSVEDPSTGGKRPRRSSVRDSGRVGDRGQESRWEAKDRVLRQLKLDFRWRKEGFGSVMEADFTVTNPTSYGVRDIEVTCVHFAPSGTRIDSNTRTIYERFKAGSTRRIRNFSMGFIHSQAKSSRCEISDLQLLQREESSGAAPGLTASEIREAQELLNAKGYAAGLPDGVMGPKTGAALKKYQGDVGQFRDGILTRNLLARLRTDASS